MTKFDLNDLKPVESTFKLSNGKEYTLKKFSLAAQIWMHQRFGAEKVQQIFEKVSIPEICETVHFLMKDKSDFPTFLDLAEAITTQADRLAIVQAIIETIGISQPMIDKITAEEKKSSVAPEAQPIGQPSLI